MSPQRPPLPPSPAPALTSQSRPPALPPQSLLELLLGAELRGVAALLLAAVGRTGREAGVALAADLLVAVVLGRKHLERGLNDTATEAEDEVEGRLLLDVWVRKGAAVLELLAGEDETLLVGGDALLVLDLGLDVVDRVGGLDLEGDGLARQSLDEDLHLEVSARTGHVRAAAQRRDATMAKQRGELGGPKYAVGAIGARRVGRAKSEGGGEESRRRGRYARAQRQYLPVHRQQPHNENERARRQFTRRRCAPPPINRPSRSWSSRPPSSPLCVLQPLRARSRMFVVPFVSAPFDCRRVVVAAGCEDTHGGRIGSLTDESPTVAIFRQTSPPGEQAGGETGSRRFDNLAASQCGTRGHVVT
ncbi:unnamed protein product [Cutaneotrichosporon oleaginosum]